MFHSFLKFILFWANLLNCYCAPINLKFLYICAKTIVRVAVRNSQMCVIQCDQAMVMALVWMMIIMMGKKDVLVLAICTDAKMGPAFTKRCDATAWLIAR